MNNEFSKKVFNYFGTGNHQLESVFAKINELQQLNQKISLYLGPSLATYCQVANLTGNKLMVIVANGSIAMQLRFHVTDLLTKFGQDPELKHIRHIDCKVRPTPAPTTLTQKIRMRPLSPQTAELIRNIAETLKDKALREVMERIASHVGQ